MPENAFVVGAVGRLSAEKGHRYLLESVPTYASLLAVYDRASRDLGLGGVEAVDPSRAGAADVSFCDGLVDMAMDGVGMWGQGGSYGGGGAMMPPQPANAPPGGGGGGGGVGW